MTLTSATLQNASMMPLTPVGGAPADGLAATFRWTSGAAPADYRLQVAQDADFADLLVDAQVGDTDSVTLYNALPTQGTTLYWRVQANQQWSATASFRAATEADTLTARQPSKPAPVRRMATPSTPAAAPNPAAAKAAGAELYTYEVTENSTLLIATLIMIGTIAALAVLVNVL